MCVGRCFEIRISDQASTAFAKGLIRFATAVEIDIDDSPERKAKKKKTAIERYAELCRIKPTRK